MSQPISERLVAPTSGAEISADDDPLCTDCGGTGITYQTERRCACVLMDEAAVPDVR